MKKLLLAAAITLMAGGVAVAQPGTGRNGWGSFGSSNFSSTSHANDAGYAGYGEATEKGLLGLTYAGGTFYIQSTGTMVNVEGVEINGDDNVVDVSGDTSGDTSSSAKIGELDTILKLK